jgi:hypothetical protein
MQLISAAAVMVDSLLHFLLYLLCRSWRLGAVINEWLAHLHPQTLRCVLTKPLDNVRMLTLLHVIVAPAWLKIGLFSYKFLPRSTASTRSPSNIGGTAVQQCSAQSSASASDCSVSQKTGVFNPKRCCSALTHTILRAASKRVLSSA